MDNLPQTGSDAFVAQIEPFRRQLQAYCYRMLGNVQEAEELAQEALLRAWQHRETLKGAGHCAPGCTKLQQTPASMS